MELAGFSEFGDGFVVAKYKIHAFGKKQFTSISVLLPFLLNVSDDGFQKKKKEKENAG